MNFLLYTSTITDIAAVKPIGANTFLANGNATFINGPTNLLRARLHETRSEFKPV